MTLKAFAIALAVTGFSLTPSAAHAQQTPPPYGPPITLEMAKKVMAAAEAEAARNNWPFVIAIIDTGGHVVMMQKSDQVQFASIALAEGKAQTALAFKMPSKVLEDVLTAGGPGLRLTALKNITPIDGGLPIIADGAIVGAIGVSGALSAQDALIARAGIEALAK
jgi:glc operon protein GlcG